MTPRQEALYRYVTAKGSVSGQTAVKEQGPSVLPLLSKMTVMGLLRRESEFSESRAVMIETAEICPAYRGLDGDSLSALVRGEKQKAALSALGLCRKPYRHRTARQIRCSDDGAEIACI